MIYLFGDESNTPGVDPIWAIGIIFSTNPAEHLKNIRKIRKECSYENRELKFSSTDYSQILATTRLIDYFLQTEDLFLKVIIKDNLYFNSSYFSNNSYKLDPKDMAYVSAYAELCKSIKPEKFNQDEKLLNIDHKPFRGNIILPKFLKKKDPTIAAIFRRDSAKRKKDGSFTGVSHMLQFTDLLTGTILSIANTQREESTSEKQVKNIYRKALLSKCKGLKNKLINKQNFYWPDFKAQKINIFYWRKQKNALLRKPPSRSWR